MLTAKRTGQFYHLASPLFTAQTIAKVIIDVYVINNDTYDNEAIIIDTI